MAQKRTKDYTDLYLSDNDMRKLKKGYTVLKHCKDRHMAIHRNPHDRQTMRKIERLKKKIKALGG